MLTLLVMGKILIMCLLISHYEKHNTCFFGNLNHEEMSDTPKMKTLLQK